MTIDLSRYVEAGDGVWWAQGGAEPVPLVDALVDQAGSIGELRAFCGLSWNARLVDSDAANLSIVSYGALGDLRRRSARGALEVVPCHYSAIPRLFERGRLPADVGFVQVSPPDRDGVVTLGIGVDYAADALLHTPTMIAEVNQRMPRTHGGPTFPLDAFAATVETDRPLLEAPTHPSDETDRAIAANVAALVSDGDTIQIGVGSLAGAVLESLAGHRELGVHSGMIIDGIVDLVEQGVVTGARKEIDPGLVITGTAMGSTRLYDGIGDMPVEFRPASYTHTPAVLAQLRSLVSINSAVEVDLLGQVGAETRGGAHVGAVGGQVDFSRAAAFSGARSIIALRSTSRGMSTINPRLVDGVVTTSRVDVDVVVTEHGAAHLTGCSDVERARRMIRVAAPEHREGLERSLAGGGGGRPGIDT